MLRLLVIERDPDRPVCRVARQAGYSAITDVPSAPVSRLLADEPDIIIVDLRGKDSFHSWFENFYLDVGRDRVTYLLIVPPSDVRAAAGHEFTGDILVTKNGDMNRDELRSRLERLVRVHASHKASDVVELDGLVIDRQGYEIRIDGRLIELTYQEFVLLSFLAENRGKVFSRQQLLDRVWGYEYFGGTRTVDIHIRRIRAKLGPRYDRHIQTVRQVGYKFVQEVSK
jgi:DNA-binding response OmpR family regulator